MALRQLIDDALRRYCEAFELASHGGPALSEWALEALRRNLRERQLRSDETTVEDLFQKLCLEEMPHPKQD